ncbi:OpgC family protein [Hirschia baltica]|uniref:OpgC protein n=1 Tax=Hirschia baltica (strain ATCC 49814 / DSM 5838 / IFAM 1418) TaxID=582402 RepID=C6XLL0_HIRBI|nr:OpgC domain-containing protein [Hirschia baltica]ACT57916.1 OpgC protein [Hirschia baltica ATCC 49814]
MHNSASANAAPLPPPASKPMRDRRLDVFRGFAVLTIFINHVPGNAFEAFTSRNWGFSDAAEAFVLMSGIAVGLAYTGTFQRGEFKSGLEKMWARAFKLYWVHLLVFAACLAILAVTISVFGAEKMIRAVSLQPLIDHPILASIGVPLLTYQIGYVNILPLYMMLLLMAPAFLWLGVRNRWLLLLISGLIWFALHILFYERIYINMPNWPHNGRWFLNPFAWQFIFVIGILGGMSAKTGKRIAPFHPVLYVLALTYALFSFYWIQQRMGALPFNDDLPRIMRDFNKAYLSLPRLLHVLSLTYLVINTKWPSWISTSNLWNAVELMGKHGLPVFAVGTVLSIFLQCFRAVIPPTLWMDIILFGAGIYIQYRVAVFASNNKKREIQRTKNLEIKPVTKIDNANGLVG